MKKPICFFVIFIFIAAASFSQNKDLKQIHDGLYLVIKPGTDSTQFDSIGKDQVALISIKCSLKIPGRIFPES